MEEQVPPIGLTAAENDAMNAVLELLGDMDDLVDVHGAGLLPNSAISLGQAQDHTGRCRTPGDGALRSDARVRLELRQLRQVVQDLELQLQAHQHRFRKRESSSVARPSSTCSRQATRGRRCLSMWRHIAVRQFRQRRDAELENEQLKTALQAQLRTADALQRLIQRAPSSPIDSSFSQFDGVFEFQSDGWMICDTTSVDGVELTRLVMQHEIRSSSSEATAQTRLALQLVSEFVVNTITEHHAALQRQLESMFLQP
ncbi:hypothetical protein P43SY_006806 [Pythium insidiosum]|uniref:Uncharacterized protein n=1 Tax=Pythium insidiosum TaxID=114742 RepID=A0AAD5LLI4_PYTIN|nr:hypothetical protein P43SY_006806 [Pythium insidiosum]